MEIKNIEVYGIKESLIRSGYPHQTGTPIDFNLLYKYALITNDEINRGLKLGNAKQGSGHDTFLKGIIVQFDLKYPQYFTPQLQRYHWIDIVSSQSKMRNLTKISDIKGNCNKYVLKTQYYIVNWLINEVYNKDVKYPFEFHDEESSFINNKPYIINSKEECFQYIISNLPMGYEMWMGISTNYLQLKTIYNQRKNHKLHDWKEFCEWIETLPMSELIINKINITK